MIYFVPLMAIRKYMEIYEKSAEVFSCSKAITLFLP